MFDGHLSLKISPKFPKNMKIKEHFLQNVIKRVEKIPPGYPRTHIKIPGFFVHSQSRDFLFQDFSGFKIPGLFSPRIFWSRDIPSTSLVQSNWRTLKILLLEDPRMAKGQLFMIQKPLHILMDLICFLIMKTLVVRTFTVRNMEKDQ